MAQSDDDLAAAPEPEHFVSLKRGTPPDGGAGVSGFCAGVGLVSLLLGIYLALIGLSNGQPLLAFATLLFMAALGISLLVWQGPRALIPFLIRTPRARVSPGQLGWGDTFCFRYSQSQRGLLVSQVTCSLVLRELVERQDPDGGPSFWVQGSEHLIESQTYDPRRTGTGDLVGVNSEFRLPEDGGSSMVSRPDFHCVWIMKVRVRLRNGMDLWEEFVLPVEPAGDFAQAPQVGARYRVVVCRYRGWVYLQPPPDALLEVAPHLHQITGFPVVALEGQTRIAAERACRRLEADGATVQLWYGDTLLKRQSTQTLPVPHEGPDPTERALPIPASQKEGEHLIELRSSASNPGR